MVAGKSPEWLPPGFIDKVRYKNGRKIKYYLNVETGAKYYSKKEVLNVTVDNGEIVTPQKEMDDDNVLSSDNKVDAISVETNDSPEWLPDGWKIEERIRYSGSSKRSVYKIYTDVSRGRKFYSKAAVIRYLNTPDHANTMTVQNEVDNVDGPNVIDPKIIEPNVNKPCVDQPNVNDPIVGGPDVNDPTVDGPNVKDPIVDGPDVNGPIVDGPSVDMSPQPVSVSNTGGTKKKERKRNSFVTVAVDSTTDKDLPPGWIKEIKTSQSGNKIRKDPYYTDPVSGYIFRSKLDALRYLETNDIRKCAMRPQKRALDGVKLIENEIPSSNPTNEKLPVHKRQDLLGGELNGGEESSGTKVVAEYETNISEQKHGSFNSDSVRVASVFEEKISSASSEKNAEMINNPPVSEVTKRAKVGPSKSRKRKDLSPPSRASKRLAGSQPEMGPISDLGQRSLRAAAVKSSASEAGKKSLKDSDIIPTPSNHGPIVLETSNHGPIITTPSNDGPIGPMPSNHGPTEEAEEQGEKTQQDPMMVIENLFNEVDEPPMAGPTVQEEQLGGKASEKQIDESKQLEESQLCYDFGDSWSDPLEFALKTLRGDISIDDTLTFPSCFNEQITVPYSEDVCSKQSQPDGPVENELASRSGSSKPLSGAVDYLPTNSSSFSALGSTGCASFGGHNCQSSAEVGKKDSETKLNP